MGPIDRKTGSCLDEIGPPVLFLLTIISTKLPVIKSDRRLRPIAANHLEPYLVHLSAGYV